MTAPRSPRRPRFSNTDFMHRQALVFAAALALAAPVSAAALAPGEQQLLSRLDVQRTLALLIYDYPGGRDDTLKQDSMWYHEQLPTASIRKADAVALQAALAHGAVEIVLENRIDVDDGRSENVIGIVRGSDFPDEWITV